MYRMRIYQAVPENLPVFHEFFRAHLLPVQLRHGARLVGRWETEDARVVAVWEYDDRAAYESIEAAVRADPDSAAARRHRRELPPIIVSQEEVFMTATVACDWSASSPGT
jgi:NIPSNAP